MTTSKYQFRHELRQLIEKHLGPSATFENYVIVSGELEDALHRVDLEGDKFSDEDVEEYERSTP